MHLLVVPAIFCGVIWLALVSSTFRTVLLIGGILLCIFMAGQTWNNDDVMPGSAVWRDWSIGIGVFLAILLFFQAIPNHPPKRRPW